jgi:hypothetical protein
MRTCTACSGNCRRIWSVPGNCTKRHPQCLIHISRARWNLGKRTGMPARNASRRSGRRCRHFISTIRSSSRSSLRPSSSKDTRSFPGSNASKKNMSLPGQTTGAAKLPDKTDAVLAASARPCGSSNTPMAAGRDAGSVAPALTVRRHGYTTNPAIRSRSIMLKQPIHSIER